AGRGRRGRRTRRDPADHRQGLRVQAVRTAAGRTGHRTAAPVTQAGESPLRRADAQEGPPAHRVGQRHPQRPARPGRTRRTDLRRGCRASGPTPPGHGRRDLAQQQDRSTCHPIPDRLRPLTRIRNYSSRVDAMTAAKIELHVHLEGTIRPATLLEIAKRNDQPLPASTVEEVERLYEFTDFEHFIQVWILTTNCLRTADDFRRVVVEYAAEAARFG